MIDLGSDTRPPERGVPVTPQLAMRVAMLGVLAFALFALVFFRLWYLQVLSGDQYRAQANDNRIRNLSIQAPRGSIVDTNGTALVDSRSATVVQISPTRLPDSELTAAAKWGQEMTARLKRGTGHEGPTVPYPAPATPALAAEFARLSHIIDLSPTHIQQRIVDSLVQLPYASIDVKVGINAAQRQYLLENQTSFPSLDPPAQEYVRDYLRGSLAAQLFGSVAQINPTELKESAFKGVKQGTIVGQSGLEATYDHFLRGVNGIQRYTVDAAGNPKGGPRVALPPQRGDQLQLTLSLGMERAGENALLGGINDARASDDPSGAAWIAMNPQTGAIYGLGSWPSIDPSRLEGVSKATYDRLAGPAAGSPLFNRVTSGLYPTGSTFKPITALAALSSHVITPSTLIEDPGCITVSTETICDAGSTKDKPLARGPVDLETALEVSSDVYFYRLGEALFSKPHQVLQSWARRLGLGASTQGDIADNAGTIPDAAWRRRENALQEKCLRSHHKTPCEIVDQIRPYSVGDNINLATGQGDLQATPLQMAVVYSALANGGTVVRPHVGKAILSPNGTELQPITEPPVRRLHLDPASLGVVMAGLHAAASQPQGTSASVFSDWNQSVFPIYGKTGTAVREYSDGEHDQSWYAAYSAKMVNGKATKPIVVVVTIEKGGFGAAAAAPAACQILNYWYGLKRACTPGSSKTL